MNGGRVERLGPVERYTIDDYSYGPIEIASYLKFRRTV